MQGTLTSVNLTPGRFGPTNHGPATVETRRGPLECPATFLSGCVVKTFLTILVALTMLATLGVLFAGLIGLARGSPDPRRSNRLMQWRVILQGSAILLLLLLMSLLRS